MPWRASRLCSREAREAQAQFGGQRGREAPNPKLQAPEKLQISTSKSQRRPMRFRSLALENSLELGAWNLELCAKRRACPGRRMGLPPPELRDTAASSDGCGLNLLQLRPVRRVAHKELLRFRGVFERN